MDGDAGQRPLTIALVAGEASGDNLGASLMASIRAREPHVRLVGIGGPRMIASGLDAWTGIDRLSVNGFVEPLKRLPELLNILLSTRDRVLAMNVDCFIGIDFNFFNLLLEGMLRKRGVATVHYVSPTVWAWREGRIRRIGKSVDLMLTLYPFETAVYEEHGIRSVFVGHPRAREIDPDAGKADRGPVLESLGMPAGGPVVALLPGSRGSEVRYTGPDFLAAAKLLVERYPDIRFVVPAANAARREQIAVLMQAFPGLPVTLLDGNSAAAMQAADVVLVNSGTATLEAMLLKRPMVMSYRLGPLTYAIVSRMVRTKWFALPNILARATLVPELIQDAASPEALADAVQVLLDAPDHDVLLSQFDSLHRMLRVGESDNAGDRAADAVLSLCGRSR